jgi:hypothetical protein
MANQQVPFEKLIKGHYYRLGSPAANNDKTMVIGGNETVIYQGFSEKSSCYSFLICDEPFKGKEVLLERTSPRVYYI